MIYVPALSATENDSAEIVVIVQIDSWLDPQNDHVQGQTEA